MKIFVYLRNGHACAKLDKSRAFSRLSPTPRQPPSIDNRFTIANRFSIDLGYRSALIQTQMAATGVLPFVRGIDFSTYSFQVISFL